MTETLDYAPVPARRTARIAFRISIALLGSIGLFANLFLIAVFSEQLHQERWFYHDLMQNPRSFGRTVDPQTIAMLKDTHVLWLAWCAAVAACAFGILLTFQLLIAAHQLIRQEAFSRHRLARYKVWKPIGTIMTTVAAAWCSSVNHGFWVAATRHSPVNSDAMWVLTNVTLLFCGLFPRLWVKLRWD